MANALSDWHSIRGLSLRHQSHVPNRGKGEHAMPFTKYLELERGLGDELLSGCKSIDNNYGFPPLLHHDLTFADLKERLYSAKCVLHERDIVGLNKIGQQLEMQMSPDTVTL